MDPTATLQSANMRNTAGRRAVLECVARADSPVSIDEIEKAPTVAKLDLDQATIYRIINLLRERGILRSVDFGEGRARFELASHPHHHHVVCTKCGAVEDVEDCLRSTANATIEKETGFKIASHTLEFFGLCRACQR